jgi:hypothetical protein
MTSVPVSMIHVIKAYRFSVVVIVTRLRAGRLDVRVPLGAEMFLFSKMSTPGLWPPMQPTIQWVQGFFPVGKAAGV